jgi:hypothetical protein
MSILFQSSSCNTRWNAVAGTSNIVKCIKNNSSRKPNTLTHRDKKHNEQAGRSYQAGQIISRKGTSGLKITPESSVPNFISSIVRIYDIGAKNSYSDHCEWNISLSFSFQILKTHLITCSANLKTFGAKG